MVLLLVLPVYIGIRGHKEVLSDLCEEDINRIQNEFNIILPPESEIESFAFMTYFAGRFVVVEIRTDNPESFIELNRSSLVSVNDDVDKSLLFPTKAYLPDGNGITAYYTGDSVYLSVDYYDPSKLGELYFELRDQ